MRVWVQRRCAGTLGARRGPAVFIAQPATRGRPAVLRAALALAIGRFACVHAGVTWTSRTTSAHWNARGYHTSVVDAAGAIYVIGGYNVGSNTYYKDVWVSTDGGARPDSVGGVVGG